MEELTSRSGLPRGLQRWCGETMVRFARETGSEEFAPGHEHAELTEKTLPMASTSANTPGTVFPRLLDGVRQGPVFSRGRPPAGHCGVSLNPDHCTVCQSPAFQAIPSETFSFLGADDRVSQIALPNRRESRLGHLFDRRKIDARQVELLKPTMISAPRSRMRTWFTISTSASSCRSACSTRRPVARRY